MNDSPGSCCRRRSSKSELALDHFQPTARFDEPTSNRVSVNVFEGRFDHGRCRHVLIVARPFLAESKTTLPRPLAHSQPIGKRRPQFQQLLLDATLLAFSRQRDERNAYRRLNGKN
jgi:hypothetical protein